MARPARYLPLAQVLRLLDKPLSADGRERCRLAVRQVLAGPAGRAQAEAEFLAAAEVLAAQGATEADLRDLLSEEDAALQRSHRRTGR